MRHGFLESLPSDIAMGRIVGAAEAAQYCNYSLTHWRRLYRAGKVPRPIKISDRKLGWRLRDLANFNSGGTEKRNWEGE
jgi:predicted DNA-binding transcriptional regulator AlpA